MDGNHALFESWERPRELPRKIWACGRLEPKKLNISMYVLRAYVYTVYSNFTLIQLLSLTNTKRK